MTKRIAQPSHIVKARIAAMKSNPNSDYNRLLNMGLRAAAEQHINEATYSDTYVVSIEGAK